MIFKKNKCSDEEVNKALYFISRIDDCFDFLQNLYNETHDSYMYTKHDDLRIKLAQIKFIITILTVFRDEALDYVDKMGGNYSDFYKFDW